MSNLYKIIKHGTPSFKERRADLLVEILNLYLLKVATDNVVYCQICRWGWFFERGNKDKRH